MTDTSPISGQGKRSAASLIQGVWRGTSIVTNDPNGGSVPTRLPNLFIYTKGYFVQVRQNGGPTPERERPVLAPPKDPNNLTEAEKLERYENWRPVAAAAGKFEIKGSTLYQYELVGRNQSAAAIELNTTGNTAIVFGPSNTSSAVGGNCAVLPVVFSSIAAADWFLPTSSY